MVKELDNKEKEIHDLTEKTIKAYENLMDDLKISEALNEVVNLLNPLLINTTFDIYNDADSNLCILL